MIKEEKKEKHREMIEAQKAAIAEQPHLNDQTSEMGLFDVAVVDPPWNYGRAINLRDARPANRGIVRCD